MRDLHLLGGLLQGGSIRFRHSLAGSELADDDRQRLRRRLEKGGEVDFRVVDVRLVRDVGSSARGDGMRQVIVELSTPIARSLHRDDVGRHAYFVFDGADGGHRGIHRGPDLRIERTVGIRLGFVAHAEQDVRSRRERRHQGGKLRIRRRLRPSDAAQARIVPDREHHVHARLRADVIDDPADVGEVTGIGEHGLPLHAARGARIAFEIEPDEVGFPDVDQLVDSSLDLGDRGRLIRARVAAPGVVQIGSAAMPRPAVAVKDVVARRVQPRARRRRASMAHSRVGIAA